MRRRDFLILGSAAGALPFALKARAQSAPKRIEVLMTPAEADPNSQISVKALADALHAAGWIEGRTVQLDIRWANNDSRRMARLADEIVAATPDVIVCHSPVATTAVRARTQQIPIVFVIVSDPIVYGFVKTLARPGGNITGISTFEFSLGSKWLELLKEAAPHLKRAAILYQSTTIPGWDTYLKSVMSAAPGSGLAVEPAPIEDETKIAGVIEAIAREPDSGLLVPPQNFNDTHSPQYIEMAARLRLPTIFSFAQHAMAGALISYGVDFVDQFTQVAVYVDRILRGARPGELPIEQPSRFELVINLHTARTLGLKIPATLLATADQVIE